MDKKLVEVPWVPVPPEGCNPGVFQCVRSEIPSAPLPQTLPAPIAMLYTHNYSGLGKNGLNLVKKKTQARATPFLFLLNWIIGEQEPA